MFKHQLIFGPTDIDKIKTKPYNGKRHYMCCGRLYPSVTTILGHRKEEFFREWRKTVSPEQAMYGANRGTWMHNTIEKYLNNEDDIFNHSAATMISEMVGKKLFNQLKPFLDSKVGIIRAMEYPLVSDLLKMGGRLDLLAEYDKTLSVVDFKSSGYQKKAEWVEDYFLQVTAYGIMWEEEMQMPISQGVVLITAEDGTVDEHIIKLDDYKDKLAEVILQYYHDVHGSKLMDLV